MFQKNIRVYLEEWMAIGGNGLMHVLQVMETWKLILLLKDMPVRLQKLCY